MYAHVDAVVKNLSKKESHWNNAAHVQVAQVDFPPSCLLCYTQTYLFWLFLVERVNLILFNPGLIVNVNQRWGQPKCSALRLTCVLGSWANHVVRSISQKMLQLILGKKKKVSILMLLSQIIWHLFISKQLLMQI